MKKLILFFLLVSKIAFSQESNDKIIYLDSLNREVGIENKYYTKIIKDYYFEKSEYKNSLLYKSGKLKEEKTLSEKDGGYTIGEQLEYYENGTKRSSVLYENKIKNGKAFSWYEDGKLKEEGEYNRENSSLVKHYKMINYWNEKGENTVNNGNGLVTIKGDYFEENGNYKNGYRDGKWAGKTKKNSFYYEEIYSDGELISGVSTDEDGAKNEYTKNEVKPEPFKGMADFYKHISNNFRAPNSAYRNKIKGKILIAFIVDKEGKIVEPKIISSLGTDLDNEAIRVLTSYENWKPALHKGRKVRCSFTIPIQLDFSR